MIYAAAPCRCQDDAYEAGVHTVEGEIVSLDPIGGVIVVRWLQDSPTIAYDEIALKVPEGLKIMKGTDEIDSEDVNQFDRVTVQYRKSRSDGLPKAVSMTVQSSD